MRLSDIKQELLNKYLSKIIDNAPDTLDTLKEIADAINDNPNFGGEIISNINNINSSIKNHSDLINALRNINEVILNQNVEEYDENKTYFKNEIVKVTNDDTMTFYISKVDNNIGNNVTDTNYWEVFKGLKAWQ